MTQRGWLLSLCLAVCLAMLAPRAAQAALDPSAANQTVQTVVQEGGYDFCSKPPHPLTARARDLCPLAHQAIFCDALVKECDDTPKLDWKPSPFWENLAKLIVKIAPVIGWMVVGSLFLLVVFLAVKAIRAATDDVVLIEPDRGQDVEVLPDPEAPVAATAAELLLRRAAELHTRGDEKGAIVTYLAAALRALDDRGAIRIARDRTNGEYLRACREVTARPPLREIVREVDLVQFGGDDATPDAVARAATRAESIVRAALVASAMVLCLVGCGAGQFGSHSDPDGRDLLADLLTKQGVHVKALPGSIAALPMNGAAGPALILDTERVPLEDETRTHLVAWVKQGGTLVLAGNPSGWPSDFWVKHTLSKGTLVRVETRAPADDDDDDEAGAHVRVDQVRLSTTAAMTWPNEDRAPRAMARLDDGEMYGALRDFGDGQILGLASADLLTNLGLVVPGNAAAMVALLSTLDKEDFAIVRREQGISPPSNPLSGLMRIGLGMALAHALVFIPLLFMAFGMRQVAPRPEPAPARRAFAEHVLAVGALYARRRAAPHALAVFARHVDDRVRAKMPRGSDPAQFLAMRSGYDLAVTTELYARAMASKTGEKVAGDELRVLERLSAIYVKAMAQS